MKPVKIEIVNGEEVVVCNKCGAKKPTSEYKKDSRNKTGIVGTCNSCKEKYFLEYRIANKEKRKLANDDWRKRNPDYAKKFKEKYPDRVKYRNKKGNEKRREYFKQYNKKNKERQAEISRNHYLKNKERKTALRIENRKKTMDKIRATMNKYVKRRCETDPLFKTILRLRCRTREAFRSNRWNKGSKTGVLLGAPIEVVKQHIESKFTEGMNWGNHGKGDGKWHIDHIIPLAVAKTKEELTSLCHYTNLQPLWGIDNMRKHKSLPENYQLKIAS